MQAPRLEFEHVGAPEAFRTLFGALAQPFVSDVGKENAPVYFALASSFMPSLNP